VVATLVETVRIGTRIQVERDCDPAMLGDAVHACLAGFFWRTFPFSQTWEAVHV
jgi:hypothetical protein